MSRSQGLSPTWFARGLCAFGALVGLIAGIPYALIRFVGSPLPTVLPSIDELRRSIEQTGIGEGTIIKLIAIVVWVAWIRLALAVIVELAATAMMRPVPNLRLLGSSQRVAGGLIATALLMFGGMRPGVASASSVPLPGRSVPAAAVVDRTLPARGVTTVAATPQVDRAPARLSLPDGPPIVTPTGSVTPATWTVQRNDSFWRIAEASLGDGQRWNEVVQANIGREVAPGITFTAQTEAIHPGWVLALPSVAQASAPAASPAASPAAPSIVEVHLGDTLASIAEDVYGDRSEWSTVWQANEGRQFGERTFDDPNVIMPGWQLQLPDDPSAPTVARTAPVAPAEAAVSQEPPSMTNPHEAAASNGCALAEARAQQSGRDPLGPTDATPQANATPEADAVPSTTSPEGRVPRVVASLPVSPPVESPTPATLAPVAAPVTAMATAEHSSRSFLPLGLGAAGLLATGALGLLAARRRTALRGAKAGDRLSALAQPLIRLERELRLVADAERLARLDLAVRLAHEHLLAPGAAGRLVGAMVHPTGEIELCLSNDAGVAAAPFHPGVESRWVLPGELALEAIELQSRFGAFPCPALVQLGRLDDAEVYLDLEAVGLLAIDGPSAAMTDSIVRAVALGLSVSPFAEQAQLVTCGVNVPQIDGGISTTTLTSADEAIDLAAELLSPILGALRAGQTTAELRFRSAGEAWEPALVVLGAPTVEPGLAVGLPGLCMPAGRGLAVVTDAPVGTEARLIADEGGWMLTPLGVTIQPIGLSAADAARVAELVSEAAQMVERAVPAVRAVASVGSSTTASSAAAPFTERDWSLMVRTLGPVDLVDRSGAAAPFERAKALELVVWLVEHRGSATRRGARSALWETEVQDATFANVVSDARRNMARLSPLADGSEWIARSLDEQLTIHGELVSDADLVRARIAHARHQDAAGVVHTLRAGLELVREAPFTASTYLWPDAEGVTSQLMLVVTEAATLMAEACLTVGDLPGVFWATGKGLLAVPGHEELISLRMRAYAATGDLAGVRAEWASYERVLHADRWSAGEPAPKLLDLRRELLGARLAA